MVVAVVLFAAAALSWWLTDDPDRMSTAGAVTMFFTMTGALAGMVATFLVVLDRSRGRRVSESTLEEYRERLAEVVRGEVGDEINLLGLAGTDYIEVEWSLNPQFSTADVKQRFSGADTNLKVPTPRDVSTIAEDWLKHDSPLTLILGGKGAGKSTTAMILMHQLLTQRAERNPEGPVPVLFRIGEWNPDQDMHTWIEQQLTSRYRLPGHSERSVEPDVAGRLVRGGQLVLIMDGFDEIAPSNAEDALRALRGLLTTYSCPVVLTSRLNEFTQAMQDFGDRLAKAVAVTLRPVARAKAEAFLKQGHQEADHWDAVIEQLRNPDSPFARALQTPLMVFLCREAYKSIEHRPERTELESFDDTEDVERHLIERFIPSRYARGKTRDGREYAPADADRWLRFIAAHMKERQTSQFEWWTLARARSRRSKYSASGPSIMSAPGAGYFMACTLALGLLLAQDMQGLPRDILFMLMNVQAFLLVTGLLGVFIQPQTASRLRAGTSKEALADARHTDTLLALTYGLVGWLTLETAAWLGFGPTAGLVAGPMYGLVVGAVCLRLARWNGYSSWLPFLWAHMRLAASKPSKLPLPLIDFLEDAHHRGILRRIGAAYEFRHGELQQYLLNSS